MDLGSLPDAARKLLGLLPNRLAAAGPVPRGAFQPLRWIGGRVIGLLAGLGAADVGSAATQAVVVGIVGVIAMDAVFAVIANAAGA